MEVQTKLLIVNYLPQTLSDEEFRIMFANMGEVLSSKIVRDRSTGYSFGFGFVEYATEQEAANAIQAMNGIQLQNKTIKVAYSRKGGRIKDAKLFVRGLPSECSDYDLEQMFASYGEIVQSRVLVDANGMSRGIGFVLFSLRDQAEAAMGAMNGTVPYGFTSPLQIQFAGDSNNQRAAAGNANSQPPMATPARPMFRQPLRGPVPMPRFNQNQMIQYPNVYGMRYPGAPADGSGGGPMRKQFPKQRFNPMASGRNPRQKNAANNGGGGGNMGHIIFAYNIGPDTNEAQLCELFSAYGTVVKSDVIRDPSTNAGRGYGFVTMPNLAEAQSAIQSLNGYCYATKPLQVSFKSPKAGAK